MPAVTATQIILDSFGDLNVTQLGDTIATLDAANPSASVDALRRLNLMMGQWAQQNLVTPAILRVVFPLVANKGGVSNPYTIGTGGNLNTPRPPNQSSVVGAGLLLNASTPPVEIPRDVLTPDGWELIRIKDLTSVLFTSVHYRADFTGDLGTILLWPVPTDATNSLVLYIQSPLTTFTDLTTTYSVPPGYDDALHANLAVRLAIPYGRTASEDLKDLAKTSFATIKRSNIPLSDLPNDFARIGNPRAGWYNIQTGA